MSPPPFVRQQKGRLSFAELKADVELDETRAGGGKFDTVIVAGVDMQGRLVGKHMTADFFVDEGYKGSQACEGLLIADIESVPHPDAFKHFDPGYQDFVLVPDLSTLRAMPWREKTAIVLCDIQDKKGADLEHSPRAILRKQIARLTQRGFAARFASELEFCVFHETYKSAMQKRWYDLARLTPFNHPDMLLIPSREEPLMHALRNGFQGAGIPVENSLGEFGAGQAEINIRHADCLEMADRHVLLKHFCHEIAESRGRAVTFMAKYDKDRQGNSSHIHCSLWSAAPTTNDVKATTSLSSSSTVPTGTPLFFDQNGEHGMSQLLRHWTAGLIKYAPDYTYLLAPYINSYRRFQPGSFAPTKLCWAIDNRTSAFRICGERSPSIRVECRIGGADLNPYLAYAALIAAGLAGIDEGYQLDSPVSGNAYILESLPEIPKSLREACNYLDKSQMLRRAFGESVVEHFISTAYLEQEEFERQVTDWERMRCFERC